MAILPGKIDFKENIVMKDKEGYYIKIKVSIHQKYILVVNIYTPNIRTPKYMKKKIELHWEIDSSTIIVGDFNTPHSIMGRATRTMQKISKMREDFSEKIESVILKKPPNKEKHRIRWFPW